jgi:hypothetical protein
MRSIRNENAEEPSAMRPLTAKTHLLAALAITAAAVATAFAIPATPAQAMTITINGDGGSFVGGSGHEVAVARKVGAFSALRVEGSVDVNAHPGTPGVVVHADDNIEPLIETVLEGDTLVVRLRRNASFRTPGKVAVDVTFASLAETQQHGSGDLHVTGVTGPRLAATIHGSGDLEIDGAQVGKFSLEIAGSGDAKLSGRADEAHFKVEGSGDVHAAHFPARRVEVDVAGSGDAEVNATDAIDARVAGSGDVVYEGHPHDVSRRVAGSGSIEARH